MCKKLVLYIHLKMFIYLYNSPEGKGSEKCIT